MGRKKKKKIPLREQVLTFEEFNAEEKVWAVYVDGSIIEGQIIEFYPNDNLGPAVTIITRERGYRTCKVKNIRKKSISKSEAKIISSGND